MISQQLERQLVSSGHAVEVFAFGVSGSGPVREVEVLEQTALLVSPDLVIFAFLAANDVRNSHPELEQALRQRLHFGLNRSTAYKVMRYFRLRFSFDMLWRADRLLNRLRYFGQPTVDQLVYVSEPYDENWVEAWRHVQSAVLEDARSVPGERLQVRGGIGDHVRPARSVCESQRRRGCGRRSAAGFVAQPGRYRFVGLHGS